MHLEILSNGLGAPSMYLLYLAGQSVIPVRVSITADTGAEADRLWSTGERSTAAGYFDEVVKPLAQQWGIEARFVRARERSGANLPELWEHTKQMIARGKFGAIRMPLFGSRGGRLRQVCTSRWKVAAIRQEARRLGAKSVRSAQGIHMGEAARRVKGANARFENGFWTYNDIDGATRTGRPRIVRWASHYYPLVDRGVHRHTAEAELRRLNIPYLVTSECDCCPHKDAARWLRTSPEVVEEIAFWEAKMNGQFFFTDRRVPLLKVVSQLREARRAQGYIFGEDAVEFGCDGGVCGV